MGPVDSDRIPRVPPYSGGRYYLYLLRVRDYHPLRYTFPGISTFRINRDRDSYNPDIAKTISV
jgi:hypothetical protein